MLTLSVQSLHSSLSHAAPRRFGSNMACVGGPWAAAAPLGRTDLLRMNLNGVHRPSGSSSSRRADAAAWQRRHSLQSPVAYLDGNGNQPQDRREQQKVTVAIVGGGPAGHTAAIYLARAEMSPVLFEGWMANGLAAGGQLTTTTYVENFPGFPEPILGAQLCDNFRAQSVRYGARVYTETVSSIDLSGGPPFRLETDARVVEAEAVIIATGAAARKLPIKGLQQYWNNGISACAVCDGSSPLFRGQPVAVVGGGDVAMEEALFLTRYASRVYIIHRFPYLEASAVMARRAAVHPKIEIVWEHECLEAYGKEDGALAGIRIRNRRSGAESSLLVRGLFFAIGHAPATAFLRGQLELDSHGYIKTKPDSTATSVPGVFAAGDVADRLWRQAVTSAGAGCVAAMEAQHFLQSHLEVAEAGVLGARDQNAAWVQRLRREAREQQAGGDKAAPPKPVAISS